MACGVPIDHLSIYVKDCLSVASHIVSVGSGNGMYEHMLCERLSSLREKLVLVDPSPESFYTYAEAKGRAMPPHHSTVQRLVTDRPDVVGDCVLLLIWPDPELEYDHEAVRLLKPRSVVMLFENPPEWPSGCAASEMMAMFVRCPEALGYRLMSMTNYTFNRSISPLGNIHPKLVWLAQRGSLVPKRRHCGSVQKDADAIPKDLFHFYMSTDKTS